MTDYQIAKQRLFNQDVKPTSLTRRGKTLIACYLTPRWDRKVLQRMIFDEIRKLFPSAAIHKVVVDAKHITRAYFSLVAPTRIDGKRRHR